MIRQGHAELKVRIEEVSRSHQSQDFQIKVGPATASSPLDHDVGPTLSPSVTVFSKHTKGRPRADADAAAIAAAAAAAAAASLAPAFTTAVAPAASPTAALATAALATAAGTDHNLFDSASSVQTTGSFTGALTLKALPPPPPLPDSHCGRITTASKSEQRLWITEVIQAQQHNTGALMLALQQQREAFQAMLLGYQQFVQSDLQGIAAQVKRLL